MVKALSVFYYFILIFFCIQILVCGHACLHVFAHYLCTSLCKCIWACERGCLEARGSTWNMFLRSLPAPPLERLFSLPWNFQESPRDAPTFISLALGLEESTTTSGFNTDSGNWTQVQMLMQQALYWLSCLPSPIWVLKPFQVHSVKRSEMGIKICTIPLGPRNYNAIVGQLTFSSWLWNANWIIYQVKG